MPPRKRKKVPEVERDPLVRFAEAITASDARAEEDRKQIKAEKLEAERLARLAAEHAEALRQAGGALDRAIAAAKSARASGRGVAEADQAWRQAKSRVIELETGEAPAWDRSAGQSPLTPDPAPNEHADG